MKQVLHQDGPFAGLRPGSLVRVIYDGAPAALMVVARVKQHAIEGAEGEIPCRVTLVSPTDLRFYAELSPSRQTVLRPVTIREVLR